MTKLPILQPSHRPQIGPRQCSKAEHAEIVKADPSFFKTADDLPYAVFIQEDGAQFLTDYQYRPLWWRPGECTPARRCDPAEYFDWFSVYWLYDNSLLPEDSKHLRKILAIVVEEFCSGGPLFVREWQRLRYAGELVARRPIHLKLVHDSDQSQDRD